MRLRGSLMPEVLHSPCPTGMGSTAETWGPGFADVPATVFFPRPQARRSARLLFESGQAQQGPPDRRHQPGNSGNRYDTAGNKYHRHGVKRFRAARLACSGGDNR
jgi:hypothetical protein